MAAKLVVGNWKMHGSLASNALLLEALAGADCRAAACAVCVPFPYLAQASARLAGTAVEVGAQNLCEFPSGAYTGEVAASMLADFACRYVIVGHSERRALFGDEDALVARKAAAALAAGLVPIICVGEGLAERDAGQAELVVARQLAAIDAVLDAASLGQVVIAYEPVWAIGTGRTANSEQIGAMHAFLRGWLVPRLGEAQAAQTPLLYGGSVKAANAAEIFAVAQVDGALVGGAALKADEFLAILAAADC